MKTNAPIDIRPAVAMDSVNIVRLIKEGFRETPMAQVAAFKEQAMLEYVTKTIGNNGFSLIADKDGRALGTIALVPIRMPWCERPVLAEAWFAIRAEHRARGIPEQLLTRCDELADQFDWPIVLGTNAIVPVALNESIVRRGRYELVRSIYVRMPTPAKQATAS